MYRAVFQQIAEEDSAYVNGDDSDYELPGFGDSLSSYDEVSVSSVYSGILYTIELEQLP